MKRRFLNKELIITFESTLIAAKVLGYQVIDKTYYVSILSNQRSFLIIWQDDGIDFLYYDSPEATKNLIHSNRFNAYTLKEFESEIQNILNKL